MSSLFKDPYWHEIVPHDGYGLEHSIIGPHRPEKDLRKIERLNFWVQKYAQKNFSHYPKHLYLASIAIRRMVFVERIDCARRKKITEMILRKAAKNV